MDKRTATLTLTEKLHDFGYINLVVDSAIKSYLLANAKSAVLDLKDGRVVTCDLTEEVWYLNSFFSKFEKSLVEKTNLPNKLRDYSMANYYFVENKDWNKASQLFVTPVAIISDVEEKVLRERFYKEVPDDVMKAFEILDTPHFIEQYRFYSSWTGKESWPTNLGSYRPFKKGESVDIGDIVQGAQSKNYYLVDRVGNDGEVDGETFKDRQLKTSLNKRASCGSTHIIPVGKKIPISDEFFTFVFSLPPEGQNIEANKSIITILNYEDFHKILLKEYSKVDHFKDYFSLLKEEDKKKIVEDIKKVPVQNKFLNSWLFNQGFDLELDYLKLYKEDAKMFIEYFKGKQQNVQELIVADLFNCEEVNHEVIGFLEKEYPHILRETAFKDK